ncbi:MAG: hypothetical protein GY715_13065 [Planctomycetes bacterium]|nr:hypothetical protein [Planctomycetota bacterium]
MLDACPLILLLLLAGTALAVDETLPGYVSRSAGEILRYHAPDPDVTEGLLVRSLDADRPIAWKTAPVPEDFDGEYAQFVWMFGLDVDAGGHRFELRVNGEPWFEFRNPPNAEVRDWTIDGPRGATLRLRATMIDRFADLMGYAILRVPRTLLTPGMPLELSVVGESAGSRAWYITFQAPVVEQAELSSRPALVRGKDGNHQPIMLSVTHLGPPVDAMVSSSFGADQRWSLELGANQLELRHPEVSETEEIAVAVRTGDRVRHALTARVDPVRHWTIDLVQHTHTDVGYTRPQTEILPEHLRFIDTALDYCDKTDGYPEAARFRWTCEASWAVREYLESRPPAQIERLRQRAREGRIEVTGMFLNMSEVIDEASYAAFLEPIRIFREHGLPVTTGMQNDINGAAWCLADYFADTGIEYLTMGQHGHRALAPFEMATSFWWESPAGNRVLAFRADHYQTGNFWGVHTGEIEPVEDALLRYLEQIDRLGYPYDRIAVQHSGYATDNSPPSTAASEFVRRWNERYAWPRLRCSIARDFMAYIKETHGDDLPVRRLAWPDWWTDGFGSAARESAAARFTQAHLVAVEGLLAMEAALGDGLPDPLAIEIDSIRDDLLFYGEHTFGAAESISDPLCENSVVQWAEKAAYAWDAVKRAATLGEMALGRLPIAAEASDAPRLLVINTLNFERSGVLELYVDHEMLPVDRPFRLLDEHGEALPVQLRSSRTEGSYWAIWVRDLPAFGWCTFRVEVDAAGRVPPAAPRRPGRELENRFYRIVIDPERGAVSSLVDKASGKDLVDPESPLGLGEIVHEALGNREQLEAFVLEDYTRRPMTDIVIDGVIDGPVWSTIFLHGELPGCEGPGGVRCEVRLFHPEKRVELRFTIQKRRNFDPEALYVAFPFGPSDGQVIYETLGGIAAPATDLLPGAASDWQAMQSFAAVQWPAGQVVLTSDEIPLVQFGEINTGKFQRTMQVDRPHVFSWVMNNYWTTNYRASQEGEFRFGYALTSMGRSSRGEATRFGWASRIPLLGRVLPGGGPPRPLERRTLLPIEAENLILIAARPDRAGPGLLLHLREVEGRRAHLPTDRWQVAGGPARVREVNVLGDAKEASTGAIEFAPFESKFLVVEGRSAVPRDMSDRRWR